MTRPTIPPRQRSTAAAADARAVGAAPWKRIADELAAEIRSRVYSETGVLPGENALARRFGVSRHTLRQALSALQSDGLIAVEQGKGAFVQPDWVRYALSQRTRFTTNIRQIQRVPGRQLLSAREQPAPDKVAGPLQLDRGATVLVVEQIDEVDGQPLALATMYFPAARFPTLLSSVQDGASITEALAGCGVADYFRACSRITTQMPTEAIAHLLHQPRTRPVLCVESVDVDVDGAPIKYGETVFSGDRAQLVCQTSVGETLSAAGLARAATQ
jgi:GntR family phosphonate transport system transcriptional regulator